MNMDSFEHINNELRAMAIPLTALQHAEVRKRFAAHLGLGDRRPDMVIRFGYAPPMPMSLVENNRRASLVSARRARARS